MDAEIKKLADNRDLKSLKYIFVDSLDVDPTFVRYEEEYNYCKSIIGLLEPHQELTPFTENKALWNEAYWTNLKRDLVKNFSDRRMTHMRQVAKIFLAEKIQRILAERSAFVPQKPKAESVNVTPKPNTISHMATDTSKQHLTKAEEQELELQKTKERLERERKAEEERIQAENNYREQQRCQSQASGVNSTNGAGSKKPMGVVVAAIILIVAAAVVAAVILLL